MPTDNHTTQPEQRPLFAPADVPLNLHKHAATAAIRLPHRTRKRRLLLARRYDRCCDVIGKLKHDEEIHYVTAGEWSCHDLLFWLLEQTGPADCYIVTWSMSHTAARQIFAKLQAGTIRTLGMVLDWRIKTRTPQVHSFAKHQHARLRITPYHAKVTLILNAEWQVSFAGSPNYTNNPRLEQGVISTDPDLAEFHRTWITNELDRKDSLNAETIGEKTL